MSSLIDLGHRLPRVVVGMLDLRHHLRRDARARLRGEEVGAELVGIEHEAAMARARRCPADLDRPRQRVLRRDVARLLVGGRADAGGGRRAAHAVDRAAAGERGDDERGGADECGAPRDAVESPSHGGAILTVVPRRLKGVVGGANWRKNRKGGALAAPPPCAMSASRPFGTIRRRRETFRSLIARSALTVSGRPSVSRRSPYSCPQERRRDPTSVLI